MAVRRIVKTGRDVLTQVITTAYVFPVVGEGETANAVEVRALWDTGATHCMITPELAERMGLHSLGQKEINAAGGKFVSNIYEMGLVLSEDIWFPRVYFGESQMLQYKAGFKQISPRNIARINEKLRTFAAELSAMSLKGA